MYVDNFSVRKVHIWGLINLAEIKRRSSRVAEHMWTIESRKGFLNFHLLRHLDCWRVANCGERVIPQLCSNNYHVTPQASPFHLVDRSRCLLLSLHQLPEEKLLFLPPWLLKKVSKYAFLSFFNVEEWGINRSREMHGKSCVTSSHPGTHQNMCIVPIFESDVHFASVFFLTFFFTRTLKADNIAKVKVD